LKNRGKEECRAAEFFCYTKNNRRKEASLTLTRSDVHWLSRAIQRSQPYHYTSALVSSKYTDVHYLEGN